MVKLDFGEGDAAARKAFAQWLAASPLHGLAWQRLKGLQDDFSRMPPVLALDTLKAVGERRGTRGIRRRQALKLLSLAGVSVLAAGAARELAPWQRLLADASTATGEQRTVRLNDGSTILLNTDTAISTAFDAARRVVTLRRGEILVATGHDTPAATTGAATRPFWVETPFGRLRALGTRFVVRIEDGRARVSVLEGAVALHPANGRVADDTVKVARAGTSWWLAADGSAPAPARPFTDDGWADGVIAGNDMRLADLLAELSRYRSGRIACDPAVADLRVSGAYQVRDTDRALAFLAQAQPVSIRYRTRFWVSVGPR
ncbi:FecR domain-containing protein [Cupriavidus sp. TMH.W2]|uniref:FecR domain-containing protein n=1 Tax=Cupriavidus sp. TMH.W2 TaxID=3434465 RepID=UPI003D7784BA